MKGNLHFTARNYPRPQTARAKNEGHYLVIKNSSQGTYLHFFRGQDSVRTEKRQAPK